MLPQRETECPANGIPMPRKTFILIGVPHFETYRHDRRVERRSLGLTRLPWSEVTRKCTTNPRCVRLRTRYRSFGPPAPDNTADWSSAVGSMSLWVIFLPARTLFCRQQGRAPRPRWSALSPDQSTAGTELTGRPITQSNLNLRAAAREAERGGGFGFPAPGRLDGRRCRRCSRPLATGCGAGPACHRG